MGEPKTLEGTEQKAILVVEDVVSIADLVASALDDEPAYKAVVANDGSQALELLEAVAVDLVLLDIQLPGIDGFAVYDHIRKHPTLRQVPVVFMTADEEALERLSKRSLAPVLKKPFQLDALLSIVASALGVA